MMEKEKASSLVEVLTQIRGHEQGVSFAGPKELLRTTEASLVLDVLRLLQGYPSNSFSWDDTHQWFYFKKGIHVSHLSFSSLRQLLQRFINAATSLRRVEAFVKTVAKAFGESTATCFQASPTLQAFASAVSVRLEILRKAAMEKELEAVKGGAGTTVTLLGLSTSLSWVCAGAEFLEQTVNEAVPAEETSYGKRLTAGEIASHILSFLYDKLAESCLLYDGEEEPYRTSLLLFTGSVQPLTEMLDTWLYEGNLSDPFAELFFYANRSVAIEDATFWQQGYSMHSTDEPLNDANREHHFSAVNGVGSPAKSDDDDDLLLALGKHSGGNKGTWSRIAIENSNRSSTYDESRRHIICPNFLKHIARPILSTGKSLQLLQHVQREISSDAETNDEMGLSQHCTKNLMEQSTSMLSMEIEESPQKRTSLYERFYQSLETLLDHGSGHPSSAEHDVTMVSKLMIDVGESENGCTDSIPTLAKDRNFSSNMLSVSYTATGFQRSKHGENWEVCLNIGYACMLPPLDDKSLREKVFGKHTSVSLLKQDARIKGFEESKVEFIDGDTEKTGAHTCLLLGGTDYGRGSGCGSLLTRHAKLDTEELEHLLPFPTVLPCFKEGFSMCELLPTQMQQRATLRVLEWLQNAKFSTTPLPAVLIQECLISSIEQQVEAIGKQVLDRLMGEWRLMEELAVLRAIYLIASGDLLQQFSSVLFNKLDRGEPWDDYYELNTMLQESVGSSADGMLLPSLDSLVVTVQPRLPEQGSTLSPLHSMGRTFIHGIDTLDALFFVYKVAWPLELIIDENALKKYNQVMVFLLKIKRAKSALEKACRWMWKNGGQDASNLKKQLLLQQKLMHFVNTLHHYVMDQVLHRSWIELCDGMAAAGSLDEVIACHDSYLMSIQRQCLVAPDKLWGLISSRVKTILGLALDFYSVQRTLCGSGTAPAIKAKCQLEIDRVGRQFDECIVFLLRVLSFKLNAGHFPHLAELVTRINFNYFYISENGQLLTPLPEVSGGRGQHGRILPA